MSDQATLDAIETAELTLQVDAARLRANPPELVASLQTLVTTRLADTKGENTAVSMIESRTAGVSAQHQQALARLADLLRNCYNGINAFPSNDLPNTKRAQVFTSYGWQGGRELARHWPREQR